MAKVPLRLYIRDIENLIDRGQTEEALAHCKHILQTYPKCIDVYRLLGKSYLESQRYTDASEILQRVLATIPDDFVAHVGMSIIREDEGNLDGAIWHMERAYETQPANTAVQDELRRLYGRRDGLEPPRVRMTRGALVRMYVKGDLYQQAIGELQAALNDEPQRDDLQVLLAKMYTKTGRRVEVIEICSKLIAKNPFCFEANRIMIELLPGTTRAEDILTYRQRVVTLDPYMAFVTGASPVSDVPDNAVMVERLDWDSNRKDASQPPWAASLGINLEDKSSQSHELPDWLASLTPYNPTGSPEPSPIIFPSDELSMPDIFGGHSEDVSPVPVKSEPIQAPVIQPAAEPPETELPDWMKEAGWATSDQPVEEPPVVFQDNDDSGEALPAAEIPEWLRNLAPIDASQEYGNQPSSGDSESLDGLDEVLAASLMAKSSEPSDTQANSMFDDIPDWLTFDEHKPAVDGQVFQAEASSEAPAAEEAATDWLSELKEFTPQGSEESTEAEITPAKQFPEAPAWAKATIPVLPNEPMPPVKASGDEAKDTYAWLEELANQHGAEAPTINARRAERVEKPPTWIHSEEDAAQSYTGPEPGELDWSVELPEDHVPEMLESGFGASAVVTNPADTGLPEVDGGVSPVSRVPTDEESFPDWLISLATASGIPDDDTAPTVVGTQLAEASFMPALEDEVATEPEVSDPFNAEQQDVSSAWLPQDEQTQVAPTEAEPGQPIFTPEASSAWVTEINAALSGLEPEEEIDVPTSEELPAEGPGFELPDWLKAELADQTPTTEALATDGIADLALTDVDSSTTAELQAAADLTQGEISAVEFTEEAADWPEEIQKLPASEAAISNQQGLETEPAEELPDWLLGLQESPREDLIDSQSLQETQPDVELPDWLRGITTEEPVLEISEPIAEEPAMELSDEPVTLEAAAEQTQEIAVEDTAPEAVLHLESETPEWLVDLQQPEQVEQVETTAESVGPGDEWFLEQPSDEAEPQVLEQVEETSPEVVPEIETEAAGAPEIKAVEIAEEVVEFTEAAPELPSDLLAAEEEPVEMLQEVEETPVAELVETPEVEPISVEETLYNRLYAAQTAIYGGQVSHALEFYDEVIRSGNLLDESIHDLRDALYRYPVDISIWQMLGDAYVRSNRLQEALDAYTKAEELIR